MLARPAWPTLRSLVLRPSPASRSEADKVCGTEYEFSRREVADKSSVVLGYAMTEKQGGSDLRETQTTALFSHSADYHGATAHWYELTGHKCFAQCPSLMAFSLWPRWAVRSLAFFCRARCSMAVSTHFSFSA